MGDLTAAREQLASAEQRITELAATVDGQRQAVTDAQHANEALTSRSLTQKANWRRRCTFHASRMWETVRIGRVLLVRDSRTSIYGLFTNNGQW
jgi:hypothetical protein